MYARTRGAEGAAPLNQNVVTKSRRREAGGRRYGEGDFNRAATGALGLGAGRGRLHSTVVLEGRFLTVEWFRST